MHIYIKTYIKEQAVCGLFCSSFTIVMKWAHSAHLAQPQSIQETPAPALLAGFLIYPAAHITTSRRNGRVNQTSQREALIPGCSQLVLSHIFTPGCFPCPFDVNFAGSLLFLSH